LRRHSGEGGPGCLRYLRARFGGLDILVANAGLASSAAIEETTVDLWRKNYDVLVEGYFLTARAAFPLLKQQKGGSIVFIGSKNALAATPNASAYASARPLPYILHVVSRSKEPSTASA
jgi:NAD(P)-dependent dehydrogenase (short-subunit alcohol dehydrogenase family)